MTGLDHFIIQIFLVGGSPPENFWSDGISPRNRFQFPRWPRYAEYWRHPNRSSTATGMKIPKFTPQVPLKEKNHGDVNVTSKMWFCPNFSITPENSNKTKWAIYLGHEEMICIVLYILYLYLYLHLHLHLHCIVFVFVFVLSCTVLKYSVWCIIWYHIIWYQIKLDYIMYTVYYLTLCYTRRTAQGGGGSFKNRKL